ncbi:AMIN-like domain-containing (lipo)protein [Nesterenkonia flava]|uniref:AMIN-like domain-containing protein n=1 Tax=Nesterenkonia flava TaxID=469799 RepID=A0ABU1FT92_9MICC|nr:hypothetical protein [Nesterenkonia flava]MDR5711883.1 hypothetical protein [Nesterenkonia flava]
MDSQRSDARSARGRRAVSWRTLARTSPALAALLLVLSCGQHSPDEPEAPDGAPEASTVEDAPATGEAESRSTAADTPPPPDESGPEDSSAAQGAESPTEEETEPPSADAMTQSSQEEAAEGEETEGAPEEQSAQTPEPLDASEFGLEAQQSDGFPEPLSPVPDDAELLLQDVRVGLHEGYDRIVFDHAGEGAPGWYAEYVEEAVEPGSGFPLDVDGGAILYLGAVGLAPGNAGAEQGHLELEALHDDQGTVFTDVRTTFVHHGAASYYIGLDEAREFRVSVWEAEDGTRLIVDVLR